MNPSDASLFNAENAQLIARGVKYAVLYANLARTQAKIATKYKRRNELKPDTRDTTTLHIKPLYCHSNLALYEVKHQFKQHKVLKRKLDTILTAFIKSKETELGTGPHKRRHYRKQTRTCSILLFDKPFQFCISEILL